MLANAGVMEISYCASWAVTVLGNNISVSSIAGVLKSIGNPLVQWFASQFYVYHRRPSFLLCL
jgi:hypothetical protein